MIFFIYKCPKDLFYSYILSRDSSFRGEIDLNLFLQISLAVVSIKTTRGLLSREFYVYFMFYVELYMFITCRENYMSLHVLS